MESIPAAAALLSAARYAIALTGAGLSVESGIPSFRGPGGLWTRYGPPGNLSYREFVRDPQGWWERRLRDEVTPGNPTYDLKAAVDNAAPNPGHLALAELEASGVIKSVITQNVDGCIRGPAAGRCWKSTATAVGCAASDAGSDGRAPTTPLPTCRRYAGSAAASSSWIP